MNSFEMVSIVILCAITATFVAALVYGIIADYKRENYDPWTGGRKYNYE